MKFKYIKDISIDEEVNEVLFNFTNDEYTKYFYEAKTYNQEFFFSKEACLDDECELFVRTAFGMESGSFFNFISKLLFPKQQKYCAWLSLLGEHRLDNLKIIDNYIDVCVHKENFNKQLEVIKS